MTYLVDANVLSEPTRPAPNRQVVGWLRANERSVVVDPIVLGEMEIGILSLSVGRKRTQLEKWFEGVVRTLQCLPWDAAVARRWAVLVADLRRSGQPLPILDSMVAATALHHDLVVATRNMRDFARTGAKVVNPFE